MGKKIIFRVARREMNSRSICGNAGTPWVKQKLDKPMPEDI